MNAETSPELDSAHIFHVDSDMDQSALSGSDARIFSAEELGNTKKVAHDKTEVIKRETIASIDKKQEAETRESPKSLFTMAYEAVRNTDIVSNIVDHAKIWYHGRYIDDVQKDIDSLEKRRALYESRASTHEDNLKLNHESAQRVDGLRKDLKIDVNKRDVQQRDIEAKSEKDQADTNRKIAESLGRELAEKKARKTQYEAFRDDARNGIVGRYESKITVNRATLGDLDSKIGEIQTQIGIGVEFKNGLLEKQGTLRNELEENPSMLASHKKVIIQMMQEIDRRVAGFDNGLKNQGASIDRYTAKKFALELQSSKWQRNIAKKNEGWGVKKEDPEQELTGVERTESITEETEAQIEEKENTLINDRGLVDNARSVEQQGDDGKSQVEGKEKDPRVEMLENLQALMKNPEFAKYGDEDYRETIRNVGTDEQNLLLKTHDFYTQLFGFLEAPTEKKDKSIAKELVKHFDSAEKSKIDPVALARVYDEIIDSAEDEPSIASLFDTDSRKRIEQGGGSPQEGLLVKLLNFFDFIFESSNIRSKPKQPKP